MHELVANIGLVLHEVMHSLYFNSALTKGYKTLEGSKQKQKKQMLGRYKKHEFILIDSLISLLFPRQFNLFMPYSAVHAFMFMLWYHEHDLL